MLQAASILRDARRNAGLTQAALAERLGVPQSVISRWESPNANPRWDTVTRVLQACGRDLAVTVTPTNGSIDWTLTGRVLEMTATERLTSLELTHRELAQLVLVRD